MSAAASANSSAARLATTTPLPSAPTLALVLATFLWSGSFVVARAMREDVDPLTLSFLRWSISLLVFLPFVWRELADNARALHGEWRLIVALGATGIALFHPLIFLALQSTTATNALLVLSLSPIAILLGAYLFGGQRPSGRQICGVLISLAGAAILITRGDVTVIAAAGLNVGDLWMLAAAVVWAAYSLLLRRRPAHLSQTATLVSSIAVALPMLLPFLLLAPSGPTVTWSMPVLAGVLYIALFGSVIGFRCWAYGVAKLGPSRAGQFVHLMPLFGAGLAFAFLGEPLTVPQIAGAALVLSGIVLIERQG